MRRKLDIRGSELAIGERLERRAMVGQLFSYMAGHGIVALFVARRAGMRLGITITRGRLTHIKRGYCRLPEGFIEAACREMERSVEEVMGAGWVRRYGADVLVGVPVGASGMPVGEVVGEDGVHSDDGIRADVA